MRCSRSRRTRAAARSASVSELLTPGRGRRQPRREREVVQRLRPPRWASPAERHSVRPSSCSATASGVGAVLPSKAAQPLQRSAIPVTAPASRGTGRARPACTAAPVANPRTADRPACRQRRARRRQHRASAPARRGHRSAGPSTSRPSVYRRAGTAPPIAVRSVGLVGRTHVVPVPQRGAQLSTSASSRCSQSRWVRPAYAGRGPFGEIGVIAGGRSGTPRPAGRGQPLGDVQPDDPQHPVPAEPVADGRRAATCAPAGS